MVATVVGHVGRGVGAAVSAVAVARMGLPALGALVGLAVLSAGVVCWVIASSERTERVSRLLLAGRGNAKCLP
jgi:phage-related minor tail protein